MFAQLKAYLMQRNYTSMDTCMETHANVIVNHFLVRDT